MFRNTDAEFISLLIFRTEFMVVLVSHAKNSKGIVDIEIS